MAEHSKPDLTEEDLQNYIDKLEYIIGSHARLSVHHWNQIREIIKEIWDDAQG